MADVLAGIAIFMAGVIAGVGVISLMVAAKNNDEDTDNPEERR